MSELRELDELVFTYQKEGKHISIYPVIHDEINFSKHGSRILDEVKPDVLAVELPRSLRKELGKAISRMPSYTLVHQNDVEYNKTNSYVVHPGEAIYWFSYLARERGIQLEFVDNYYRSSHSWSVPLRYYHLASIGWEKFWEEGKLFLAKHLSDPHHYARSHKMAERLLEIDGDILLICGAAHWPITHLKLLEDGYTPEKNIFENIEIPNSTSLELEEHHSEWKLSDIHPHTLHLASNDLPYYLSEMIKNDLEGKEFNNLDAIRSIFFEAEKVYNSKFDDKISLGSYVRLFQYLRNLCRIAGKILPDLYDLILVAKGMGDDDYAYEVFRTAVSYPFSPEEPLDDQVKFMPSDLQNEVIKFAFKRRYRRPVLKEVDNLDDFDPIPEEEYTGQWKEIWDEESPEGYVSYPPEDEYLERYLRFLEKKLTEVLREEKSQSLQFDTSLEDGIDWRQTISHYHEGKMYVKKYPRNVPPIGALIVQFAEEPVSDEYRHYSTLYAEHERESHLSIFSTEVAKEFVGPGICRIRFAAIISQFPPLGIPVRIPYSEDDLKLKLIYAAMNMSLSNIIGFVSPKPPSSAHRYFASQYGFRIIYLPMIQLTKSAMHRLKTMHLLANRSFREDAGEYIGF